MKKLITLFADNRFHTTKALALKLGLTNATVCKQLQQLKAIGLPLETINGETYRLNPHFQPASSEKLYDLLKDLKGTIGIETHISVTSTNDIVRSQAASPEPIQICIAEHQSSGRGRRGKSWLSPCGTTICFSMLRKFGKTLANLNGLSLVVGLATREALQEVGCHKLQLKWPNDIVHQGKKLAGVLLETQTEPDGTYTLVIGIGINVHLQKKTRKQIKQATTDLNQLVTKTKLDKNLTIATLSRTLIDFLLKFEKDGFSQFVQQWHEHDYLLNHQVELTINQGQKIMGIEEGINEQGALILKLSNNTTQSFNHGEISLRKIG